MSRSKKNTDANEADVTKVVLDVPTAEEVVDLIEDAPGVADEETLDDALQALESAGPRVPAPDQQRAANGEAVAIELGPEDVDAVETLIVRDEVTRPKLLRRVGQRLRGKLQRARRKARRS